MPGNSQVVNLSIFLQSESLVAAGLMRDTIAVPYKPACEVVAINIPGYLHTAISSSFTT